MERLLANVEGTNPPELVHLVATPEGKLIVTGISGGGSSGSSVDRELVVSTYRCKVALPGASIGDTITATQVIDVSGTIPSTVSTIWRNQSTAADIATAPGAAALELTGSTALTDAQLRASALATAPNITRGAGNIDANTQRVVLAADGPTVSAIQSIDLKTPALFGGAVPVVGPLTAAELSIAGLAKDAVAQAIRDRLPSAFQTPGLLAVDTLGTPAASKVQATSGASAPIALTTTCRRVSMYATAGTWYSISGTASTASHYIGAGERLDFDVPASTTINVLQETAAGSIRITELS